MPLPQHKSIKRNQEQQGNNASQRPRITVRTVTSYSLVAVLCVPVFMLLS